MSMEFEHEGHKMLVVIHCVFREPGENEFFAVVENERTERILIIRINAAVFNALRALGVPECPIVGITCTDCDHMMGPICIHCVFKEECDEFFAVLEDERREQITIAVINETTFNALRAVGIPLCPVVSCHEDRHCKPHEEE